jgi:glycine/D-amino acid oxidase-like deaminating enzyme
MTKTFDAVIVGAGIVGAACAMEFARDGMNLAIVEKNEIGGGATAAAMGHVVVLDDSPAQLALTRYSQLLWQKMAGELPREAEYAQPGTLWVAADDEEMQEVWRKDRIYREQGIPCQVLEGPALARIEPALRGGLAGALAVAEDAVVLSQAAAQFFLHQALATKGTLYRETVTTMGSGKVLLSSGEELHARVLVNAAGEWAAELTAGLPVVKRKGHLAMSGRFPGVLRHQVVELGYLKSAHSSTLDSVAFNVQPRSTGQLLIGSSRQYGVESREVDEEILGRMLRRATEYLPGLASVPIERTWTGFRAATPDKLPLIGPLAEDATVFAATGHEGLGITTSLATARLLADLIAGRRTAIPIEPYLPSRSMGEKRG